MARVFVVIAHGFRVLETVKDAAGHRAPTWFTAPSNMELGFLTNIESCTPGGCPIGGKGRNDALNLCTRLAPATTLDSFKEETKSAYSDTSVAGLSIEDPKVQV